MTNMSNLPRELVEEILSRVPMTSLKRVRLTCKNWNALSKDVSFPKKHLGQVKVAAARERDFFVVTVMDSRVYLMRINLHSNVESCINREGQVSLNGSHNHQIDVLQIFPCDGLLLCLTKDNTRLLVWNPYLGQTRWIEPVHNNSHKENAYALGYEKKIGKSYRSCYKILSCIDVDFYTNTNHEYQIYSFNSGSWRVLDVSTDWYTSIRYDHRGVSLDGNTYWIASDDTLQEQSVCLMWFDFTREIFAPHLPLPFQITYGDIVTLSSVREEKLAVLIKRWDTLNMEIWITNKIESDAVSWSCKFCLSMNMRLLSTGFKCRTTVESFLIDEEKKVVVLFARYERTGLMNGNVACIVGVDGALEEVELGESYKYCFPLVCSYFPSLVQLN